jgi:Type II secretion system (T2SS), protein E, N-terminal domain
MKGRMSLASRSWSSAWRNFWNPASRCGYCGCVQSRSPWRGMGGQSRGVRMQGERYCRTECMELALVEVLGRAQAAPQSSSPASHRIPLGLLLLSRQQLTAVQLRTALEAQREAVRGKNQSRKRIGAWLQELGFSTEQQVTAALARQWCCPVLRAPPMAIAASRFPPIPTLLLESFQMIPVELVGANGTLLMAFSEGIDYTVLYAIERMLGYHTEACLVCPSTLRKSLQALAGRRGASDVVFERTEDAGECARIIVNYSAKVQAEEVRVARCGEHLWVRLERGIRLERLRQEAVTLVLRAPGSSQFPVLSSQFSAL